MATKWYTTLEVAWNRYPILCQGHPSNFKVTRAENSTILTLIEHFRTLTPVSIHKWLRNDVKTWSGIKEVPHFFQVICPISRSQWPKNRCLAPIWAFPYDNSNLNPQMAMNQHIHFKSKEEVPYFFRGHLSNFKVTRAEKSIRISYVQYY